MLPKATYRTGLMNLVIDSTMDVLAPQTNPTVAEIDALLQSMWADYVVTPYTVYVPPRVWRMFRHMQRGDHKAPLQRRRGARGRKRALCWSWR